MALLGDYSALLTAIATMFLVIATYLLMRATKQLTEVNKKTWIAQDRPLLQFFIKRHGDKPMQILFLYVKNVGKGNALDIRFDIYMNNKHEPENMPIPVINLLAVDEERMIKQLVGSGTINIEELVYEDINEFEYSQEVDILEY